MHDIRKAARVLRLGLPETEVVEFSRSIVFGEDRLTERGSLPTTFFVLTRLKYLILINKVS